MTGKADVETPISLVQPSHARSVQAILDRAHLLETAANKSLYRSIDKALRPPRGKSFLSETFYLALLHHSASKKGGPSMRPTAPDTNGRSFHFSYRTVGRNDGSSKANPGTSRTTGKRNGASPGSVKGSETTRAPSTNAAHADLGSKEAGHQRYLERDTALAKDAAEEFDHVVERSGINGTHEAGRQEDRRKEPKPKNNDRPMVLDVTDLRKEIERPSRSRKLEAATAGQAYIEDPSKVPPQTRHGHSNSFGTIGATFEERLSFWDLVNEHETREKDGRTQIRLVLELPHEATAVARQEIVKRFCKDYEELGIPYWASIHAPTEKNDDRNHHAHIVLLTRPAKRMVDPGTGLPQWDFAVVEEYRTSSRNKRTRHPHRQNVLPAFRKRDHVSGERKRFADIANEVLEACGCPVRYDERSYEDMGLDIEPIPPVKRIKIIDPERTRKMAEREVYLNERERDRIYMQLEAVERRLAAVAEGVTKFRDANAKLPLNMKISPFSTLTKATAKRITAKMLEIEQLSIEQRFADEAIARTIQNVLDATSPTSPHRGGKPRQARPAPGIEIPDMCAMAFLHEAATEEMRLHRIASSGRIRSMHYRARGALDEWRQAASPVPKPETPDPAPTQRSQFATGPGYQPPMQNPDIGMEPNKAFTQALSAKDEPTVETGPIRPGPPQDKQAAPVRPSPAFIPGASPTEMAIGAAVGHLGQQRMLTVVSKKMGDSIAALISFADGPQELADMVKAMLERKTKAPTPEQETPNAPTPGADPSRQVEPQQESATPVGTGIGTKAQETPGETSRSLTSEPEPAPQHEDHFELNKNVHRSATSQRPRKKLVRNPAVLRPVKPAAPAQANQEPALAISKAIDSRVEPSSSSSDYAPVRILKSSPPALPALDAEVEQPVGTAFAAELLENHRQYRLVRYDRRSRTVWMIARDGIWDGTASPSSYGAHGLGPALAQLGVSWRSAAYPRHPDLIVYEMQFEELAEALGRLPKTTFEGWCDRLRRATSSSDARRRDAEHAAKIGEPRQTNSEKLNKQGGREPESGGGITM